MRINFILYLYRRSNQFFLYICTVVQIILILYLYRCTNHFYSPSVPLFTLVLLYRVIKKSLCTWHMHYNYQVHRDFLTPGTSVSLSKSLSFHICTAVHISFIIHLYRCPNHFYSLSVPLFTSVLLYICTVVRIIFILHLYRCSH